MRLVHIKHPDGTVVPGVQTPDESVALMRAMLSDAAPPSVTHALAEWDKLAAEIEGHLAGIRRDPEAAVARGALIPAASVRLRAPVGDRNLIVCAGGNYRSHASEMNIETPPIPTSFIKSSASVIGSGEAITIPGGCPDMVDFEGEICVVFGRTCHAVTPEEAMSYVGGFTILNDVSARDGVRGFLYPSDIRAGQWGLIENTMYKQLPTFAPIGPGVTTTDDVPDPASLHLVTKVNGKVMQDATTADLVVDIPTVISQMSRYYAFRPGDVMSTGTPAGVGFAQDPPVFLHPGDTVSIEVSSLGILSNEVRARP
jgi:2-keto-4-pentenoate hydratase/2-oxohepta-3-ene-1,7-dioic acid hydratase in catechol pathway